MTETPWPALRVDDWTATRETLHRWMQVVGKIRLAQAPMVNHWWQVTLYVTPRGLTVGDASARHGPAARQSVELPPSAPGALPAAAIASSHHDATVSL